MRALNDNDDDDAQHGDHPANTKSCSLGLQYVFDILHPYYGQLTPVKTRYSLTNTI